MKIIRREFLCLSGITVAVSAMSKFALAQAARVACREYEQLRARGVAHDAALRHALGVGPASSQHRCRAAHPLYFAGRA